MKRSYKGLWCLLAISFVAFFAFSFVESDEGVKVGAVNLRTPKMADALALNTTAVPGANKTAPQAKTTAAKTTVQPAKPQFPVPVDTATKVVLIIGDSMLEGLTPRLAAYCNASGHTLYAVTWYSSTSEVWGKSDKLAKYIKDLKPDFIFLSLGANELFIKDIATKRDKYVKKIIADIGNIPFVWIGPPNWKPDTGINDLVAANVPKGSFFLSNGMKFDRAKDGAHPTRQSASLWMDSIVRWMPKHCNHPIRLDKPTTATGKAKRSFMHSPAEIKQL